MRRQLLEHVAWTGVILILVSAAYGFAVLINTLVR